MERRKGVGEMREEVGHQPAGLTSSSHWVSSGFQKVPSAKWPLRRAGSEACACVSRVCMWGVGEYICVWNVCVSECAYVWEGCIHTSHMHIERMHVLGTSRNPE